LKNAHTLKGTRLLCCAANRTVQRISIYASQFGFLRALHLNIHVPFRVFEQPQNMGFFNDHTAGNFVETQNLASLSGKIIFILLMHIS
jgi:hypothetical protein